jgi:hypothetical protein
MHLATLACAAGLFAALGSVSYAGAVLTTDPTGFTNEVSLISQFSPFTDPNGNTATMVNLPGAEFGVAPDSTATFMVEFAHPVVKAGFDIVTATTTNQGPFQLSNGDSTASSSCSFPPGLCFLGVTDTTPFTSFSIVVTGGPGLVTSTNFILDFRYTPASVPEPAAGTLVAPLLIAGFAAWRLKKRAK